MGYFDIAKVVRLSYFIVMEVTLLRAALKDLMERENLTAINVASACDVDDETVIRFIEGRTTPRRLTLRMFNEFVTSRSLVSPESRKAAIG